jgi:hypothetical protein
LSQFGPFQSGELLSADVLSIHGKTWVLVSTRQSSGLGDIISVDGEQLILGRDWQTSLASYRKNADGDLLVTLWPSNRNEGLPRIWRHDGIGEYPAPKEERALLETVAKDAASDVESFQDNGASPPLTLVYDCSRILQAEASVGNLVAALRTCGPGKNFSSAHSVIPQRMTAETHQATRLFECSIDGWRMQRKRISTAGWRAKSLRFRRRELRNKPHDAGIGASREQVARGCRPGWMLELRRDFGERRQNEFAFEHSRMRDLQFGSKDRLIAEEKNVDVEEARAFGESFSAAKLGLDGAEGMQELDGLRIGFTFDDAIEEPGLVEVIDRLGFVEGRNFMQMKICRGQRGDGGAQVRGTIA